MGLKNRERTIGLAIDADTDGWSPSAYAIRFIGPIFKRTPGDSLLLVHYLNQRGWIRSFFYDLYVIGTQDTRVNAAGEPNYLVDVLRGAYVPSRCCLSELARRVCALYLGLMARESIFSVCTRLSC